MEVVNVGTFFFKTQTFYYVLFFISLVFVYELTYLKVNIGNFDLNDVLQEGKCVHLKGNIPRPGA